MMNSLNKKEEHAVLPADFLRDLARLKGRAAPQQLAPVAASILYPVSAAARKAEEEALKNARPGQEILNHGVFIGTWQPEGLSLKFNIFAAKEDLTDEAGDKKAYTYNDTVRRIAELKDWHGFDGTNYAYDQELYDALKNGSYIREGGGWFIPPQELMTGMKAEAPYVTITQPDNLYDYKDKGDLSGTFCAATKHPGLHQYYWSSTEHHEETSRAWNIDFQDGSQLCDYKSQRLLSCRPVRLELAP